MGDPAQPMLEAYSALSYLAASTTRVKLGALVTGVIYRHPGALIKTVTSARRAEWRTRGAGHRRGLVRARGARTRTAVPADERTLRAIGGDAPNRASHVVGRCSPFEGQHYTLAEPTNSPQPISRPHPPITIGGLGERKTLRFVAQYGDACNLFSFAGPDFVRAKLDVLRRHCDAVGRPYEQIERTGLIALDLRAKGIDDVIADLRGLSDAGLQRVDMMLPQLPDLGAIETIGSQIIPVVREFGEG